jgi:hypothetical protein
VFRLLTNDRELIAKAPTNEKTNTNATKDDDKIEPSQGELCP